MISINNKIYGLEKVSVRKDKYNIRYKDKYNIRYFIMNYST